MNCCHKSSKATRNENFRLVLNLKCAWRYRNSANGKPAGISLVMSQIALPG
jgi:hypothetical protein